MFQCYKPVFVVHFVFALFSIKPFESNNPQVSGGGRLLLEIISTHSYKTLTFSFFLFRCCRMALVVIYDRIISDIKDNW